MALLGADNQVGILIKADSDLRGIDDANKSLGHLESSAGGSGKVVGALGAAGKLAAVGMVAAGAAIGAAGFAAVTSAGSYEQSRIAFETMLGSAEKAQGLMTEIAAFAKTTPFELPEVVQGTKQLLAFGFAQKDLLPTMRKLGDLASGLGVPVGQLTNVFGQVKVAGRLMGQDLLQFTNAGVPMIEALATTMKKPQSEIKKLVEQGNIGFPEVEVALNSLTKEGSKFGGMMDKQSKTFNGVVSNIKDGFGQILRSAVGITVAGDVVKNGLFDRIKNAALATMPVVQKAAENVGPAMMRLIELIGDFLPKITAVAKQVGDYLEPKLRALFRTINESLIPVLSRLWHEIIEPLIPVLGTVLVAAIGFAVDAVNAIIKVMAPIMQLMLDHKPIVIALATAFGVLALAMNFGAIVAGFNASINSAIIMINVLRLVTIPAALTSLGAFAAGFGPVGIAAVIAAGVIIDAGNKAKAAWDRTSQSIQSATNSNASVIQNLQNLSKNGTPEQKERAKITLKKLADSGSFASGGFTGRGGIHEIAGIVHKGEYVLPQNMVNQSTGQPKPSVTNNRDVSIGTIVLGDAGAVREMFRQLDSDQLLVGSGLTPKRGAF